MIFLTSKDDEVDEVLGLRMGADDYIRKPFSQRLLIERIRALLRRQDLLQEKATRTRSRRSPAATWSWMGPGICTWKGETVALTVTSS